MKDAIEKRLNKAKKDRRIFLILFSSATAVFLAATLCSLLFSPRRYIFCLIVNVVLTLAYGSGSVYAFSNVYSVIRSENSFFDGLCNGRTEKLYATFESADSCRRTKDNMDFVCLYVVGSDNGETYSRQILCFPDCLTQWRQGQRLSLTLYKGVLIDWEEI